MNARIILDHHANQQWRKENNIKNIWDTLDILGYQESGFGFISEMNHPEKTKTFNSFVSFMPDPWLRPPRLMETEEQVQIYFSDRSILSHENGHWVATKEEQ